MKTRSKCILYLHGKVTRLVQTLYRTGYYARVITINTAEKVGDQADFSGTVAYTSSRYGDALQTRGAAGTDSRFATPTRRIKCACNVP
jgi:hypothetical protein